MIKYTVEVNDDGDKFWHVDDTLHCEHGPAIEKFDGAKFWYVDGELHRTDGPAVDWADGHKEWWLNGEELTEEQFLERKS